MRIPLIDNINLRPEVLFIISKIPILKHISSFKSSNYVLRKFLLHKDASQFFVALHMYHNLVFILVLKSSFVRRENIVYGITWVGS